MSCNCSDPEIALTYAIIQSDDNSISWMVMGYKDTRDKLFLYRCGSENFDYMRKYVLELEEVVYIYQRIESKRALITFISDRVAGVKRARALVHGRSVATAFPLTITNVVDFKEQNFRSKLHIENDFPSMASLVRGSRDIYEGLHKTQSRDFLSHVKPATFEGEEVPPYRKAVSETAFTSVIAARNFSDVVSDEPPTSAPADVSFEKDNIITIQRESNLETVYSATVLPSDNSVLIVDVKPASSTTEQSLSKTPSPLCFSPDTLEGIRDSPIEGGKAPKLLTDSEIMAQSFSSKQSEDPATPILSKLPVTESALTTVVDPKTYVSDETTITDSSSSPTKSSHARIPAKFHKSEEKHDSNDSVSVRNVSVISDDTTLSESSNSRHSIPKSPAADTYPKISNTVSNPQSSVEKTKKCAFLLLSSTRATVPEDEQVHISDTSKVTQIAQQGDDAPRSSSVDERGLAWNNEKSPRQAEGQITQLDAASNVWKRRSFAVVDTYLEFYAVSNTQKPLTSIRVDFLKAVVHSYEETGMRRSLRLDYDDDAGALKSIFIYCDNQETVIRFVSLCS